MRTAKKSINGEVLSKEFETLLTTKDRHSRKGELDFKEVEDVEEEDDTPIRTLVGGGKRCRFIEVKGVRYYSVADLVNNYNVPEWILTKKLGDLLYRKKGSGQINECLNFVTAEHILMASKLTFKKCENRYKKALQLLRNSVETITGLDGLEEQLEEGMNQGTVNLTASKDGIIITGEQIRTLKEAGAKALRIEF